MSAPTGRPVTFAGFGGITLAGEQWGNADGPLVLLLHGGGQTRHSWKSTGAQLAASGARVIALDARGHGDSEWSAERDYRREAMARDVVAVLDELGEPAVIVGASMGGLCGLYVSTLVGPELLSALVLVDVVPRPEEVGVTRVIGFLTRHREGFATLDEAGDAVAAYLPHRPKPRSTEGLRRNLRFRDGRWFWHWDPGMFDGIQDDPTDVITGLEAAARNLTIPTLLVRGKLSDVVSDQGVADFVELVPHAKVVELSGAAHTAAGDDNDAFTQAVCDFVVEHGVHAR